MGNLMNIIIIAVIVLAVIAGVIHTAKHFRGEGGCCGGGSYKPRRKKLQHVGYTQTFQVEGMHCEHCKNRVEEIVNDLDGVAGRVNLKKGELVVSYESGSDVEDSKLKACIDRAGYCLKL